MCVTRGPGQVCVPPVSRHPPLPHQPAGPEAESDRICRQSARLLLPQKLLVPARVPSVLHTGTGWNTAAPVQGLYTITHHEVLLVYNYTPVNKQGQRGRPDEDSAPSAAGT